MHVIVAVHIQRISYSWQIGMIDKGKGMSRIEQLTTLRKEQRAGLSSSRSGQSGMPSHSCSVWIQRRAGSADGQSRSLESPLHPGKDRKRI